MQGDQWVGFDSEKSLRTKTRYLMEKGLGGALVWTFDLDDFTGQQCGQGKYPLINVIKTELNRRSGETETEQPDQGMTPSPSVVAATTVWKKLLNKAAKSTAPPTTTTTTTKRPSTKKTTNTTTTSTTTTTVTTTRKKTFTTTTSVNLPQTLCQQEGVNKYPGDCGKFVSCLYVGTPFAIEYVVTCPEGLQFNSDIGTCDYPIRAQCVP